MNYLLYINASPLQASSIQAKIGKAYQNTSIIERSFSFLKISILGKNII